MSFGAYLVGAWESRLNMGTNIQIINPMVYNLNITVALLDHKENFLLCKTYELSPNDMEDIFVPNFKLKAEFGVVKVISHNGSEVKEGIVGYQRHFILTAFKQDVEVGMSEAQMAAIQNLEYAKAEFERFNHRCP